MKKIFVLLLLVLILPACSLYKKSNNNPSLNYLNNGTGESAQSAQPAICANVATPTAIKDLLPPISPEEKKKTFTFEDEEMGVKLKYPGSCFFNKGVFQCSNFTMSIWVEDGQTVPEKNPTISVNDKETEIKYFFPKNGKQYILVAWYDGKDQKDLEATIDKISKSFTFIR
jgi:hypothetical protein